MSVLDRNQVSNGVSSDCCPSTGVARTLASRSAFVLSLGGALLVMVSLGPMAVDLGVASVFVWVFTALIGFVQCLFIAALAGRYPQKLGGAPAYNHEGLKHLSPLFGAVSAWGYWIGWIPGVAVNLMLAAEYIRAAFFPHINVISLTLALVVVVYALNYLGLRFCVCTSAALAICAGGPLLIILGAPLVRHSLWTGASFHGFLPSGGVWYSSSSLLLLAKWMFVAVWSSYGAEMITTTFGELRDPRRNIPKAVGLAATVTLLAFAVVPTVMVGLIGAERIGEDPYIVFLTATRQIFGNFGASMVSLMLIAALILGAQLFIISSSRALYQMGRDGLTLRGYARLTGRGVPVGSIRWDALVTLLLLAIFQDNIVNVVSAANVGYLVVFILLPIAYVIDTRRHRGAPGIFVLPRFMVPVALCIAVYNLVLLLVGGSQWGSRVMGVGFFLLLTFLPFYLFRRQQNARENAVASAAAAGAD